MARNIVGSKFDDYVKEQIKRRQKDFSNYIGTNDSFMPEDIIEMRNVNTAYLKLTSGVDVNLDKGAEAATYALFNTRFGDEFASGVGLGGNTAYGWQSLTGYGYTPPPGLISAEVKSLNRGSLREATIKLLCHNATQFEIIDQLYLRLGYSMLLEWGWSIFRNNDKPFGNIVHAYSTETMATKFLTPGIGQLEILNNIKAQRINSCGNYDAMLGLVKNYSWDLLHDGSYDISISLVAVGDVIESLKTNTSHPNNTLKTPNVPDDQPPLQYNAQKSTLNKIIWWLTEQLAPEDIYKAGKYFLQGADATADKIAAGVGLKANQNNDDTGAQGEVIGAIFPQLLGVKGSTPGVQAQYYMKLGFLLRCIQNFCLLYDSNSSGQALINIDFDKNANFCFTYPRHGSLDPRVCLIDVIKDLDGTAPPAPPGATGTITPTPTPPPTTSAFSMVNTTYTWRVIELFDENGNPIKGVDGVFEEILSPDVTTPLGNDETLLGNYFRTQAEVRSLTPVLNANQTQIQSNNTEINTDIQKYTPPGGIIIKTENLNGGSNPTTTVPIYLRFFEVVPKSSSPTVQDLNSLVSSTDIKLLESITAGENSAVLSPPIDIGLDNEQINSKITKVEKSKREVFSQYNPLIGSNYLKKYTYVINEYSLSTVKFADPNKGYSGNGITPPVGENGLPTLDVNNNLFDNIRQGSQFRYDPLGKSHQFIGKTLNMYVNMDYIAKTLEDYIDVGSGAISLFDFLDKLMKGIQHALGNINNFNIIYDQDTNQFSIIDSTFIPGLGSIPEAASAFEEPTKFITHTLDADGGSFIRDASVKTQLSNNFATMVTVGAQANGNVVGANATALSRWNTGLTDRIILYKSSKNDPPGGSANIDTSFYSNVGIVQNLYSAINDGNITDEQINGSKDAGVDLFGFELGEYVNEGIIPSIGFLPINLELTMDGLSGIRIYESYTADTRLLPIRYQDKIQFIATGISHRIQNNDWTTTLTSISGPKYDGITVGTVPAVKSHNFGQSNATQFNGPAAPAGNNGGGSVGGGSTSDCTRLANGKLVHTGNEPQFKNRQRTPRSIILHVTDGNPNGKPQDTVNFVGRCNGKFRTGGIHYAIGRDGAVASGIPENIDCVHGDNWNKYGIGIEINHPYTVFERGGKYYWADGYEVPQNEVAILPWSYNGNNMFMEYSPQQLQGLKSLIKDIWGRYPEIKRSFSQYSELLLWRTLWGFSEIPQAGKNYTKKSWKTNGGSYGDYGIFGHSTGGGTHGDPAPTPGLINMLKGLITEAK